MFIDPLGRALRADGEHHGHGAATGAGVGMDADLLEQGVGRFVAGLALCFAAHLPFNTGVGWIDCALEQLREAA
ncbi:hypothetical protein SJI00_07545 [Pseudomonas sp. RP23018S]|uniref:hypothetical protein n=1 Tax=Pseudomonas sp. RP23018S TaxID=3096037 RepID=UPI002ACA8F3B|nr:hypothetical protein [Pseudomonas sp. RP23018S]MDZ5602623.1 hypothetical protein [Pseudomonas sp. RP23018S]